MTPQKNLRTKHPQLVYKSFDWKLKNDNLEITSHFVLSPNIKFSPRLTIQNVSPSQLKAISPTELEQYIFHLGLAEILSYWKCAIPPEIVIEAGHLSPSQIKFWHNLLIKGMGEFFYVNQIDFTREKFVKIISKGKANYSNIKNTKNHLEGTLVPLGGGKDSLVTLETLKKHTTSSNNQNIEPLTLFALNPVPSVLKILEKNPNFPAIIAHRQIDPQLIRLNQAGYLNGHTPFSSYLAFLSVFVARLFGIKYIAVSNESSANEKSVTYKNHDVNHQYSKSFEFENDFQRYIEQNFNFSLEEKKSKTPKKKSFSQSDTITPYYFSFLRPLNELQIAHIFSDLKEYFPIFTSCNKGQRDGKWCNQCGKCLFAFLILQPFLTEDEINNIFDIKRISNINMWPTLLELIGKSEKKPLDCVGTLEESIIALHLQNQKVKQDIKRLNNITKKWVEELKPHEKNLQTRSQQILKNWNEKHSLPPQFEKILKKAKIF